MDTIIERLKDKLNEYYSKAIPKEVLGKWANEEYYNILCGDYIIIDNLKTYKFLKTIATFHLEPNDAKDEFPCTEEDILNISRILSGEKDIVFIGNIKVHNSIYDRFSIGGKLDWFLKVREIVNYYLETTEILFESRKMLKSFTEQKGELKTIIDILEMQVSGMVSNLFLDTNEELLSKEDFRLFVGQKEFVQQNSYIRLLNLLDCLVGNNYFGVNIIFESGRSNITLLI